MMNVLSAVIEDEAAASRPVAGADLAVSGLEKVHGALRAVDGVSFEARQGEFFTLLGPSGCGKTTALMCIAGLQRVDGGRIVVGGRDVTALDPDKRDMGMVFQSYALFPHMTALENVMYPLKMRKVPREECVRRARAALAMVELDEAIGRRRPAELSGGQQQRVALSRAMVYQPKVLLMDEPLSALDRRLRQTLQYELRRLQHNTGVTVIYVTHDQEEAVVLSDRIAVMRDGRIEQLGSPRAVYQEPVSGFVAQFLGTSNSVAGMFSAPRGEVAQLQAGEVVLRSPHVDVTGGLVNGQEASLYVRPEDVEVTVREDASDAHEGGNQLAGTVADLVFLGDHLRAEVALEHGGAWVVNMPIQAGDAPALHVGAAVELSWRAEAGRILPERRTSTAP